MNAPPMIRPLKSILFSLFLLCSCSQEEHKSQVAEVWVEESGDLPDFFHYSFSNCLREWEKNNSNYNTTVCSGQYNEHLEELHIIRTDEIGIPAVQISKNIVAKDGDHRNLFIYIIGGPLQKYPRIHEYFEQYQSVEPSDVIIIPIYQSTWFRSSGNAIDDLQQGQREIEATLRNLRATNPMAKIHVLGESWGGYFASRLPLEETDQLIIASSPLNHTGNSLADYFRDNTSDELKETATSFALSVDDYTVQLAINRYDYMTTALRHIGDEPFVLPRRAGDETCRIVVYGKNDPMLAGFDRPDGYSSERREWVISRQTGHDTLDGYNDFFSKMAELECTDP